MAGVGATDTRSPVGPVATLASAVFAAIAIVVTARMLFGSAAPSMVGAIGPAGAEAVFTVILFGALLAVAWIGLRLDGGRGGLLGRAPALRAASGAAIGLIALLASAALALLAGTVTGGTGESQSGVAILIGTATILFQAWTEEIYFRGWLQPVLVRHWGKAAGLLIASVAFAALHIAGGARTPLTLVNLLLGGLLFGLLALRSGGLAAPIAAHAAYNWAEQILLGLDPNPGTGSFGALLDYDLAGSAWWGGSDEGLNASLAVSFVLIAVVLPLAMWRNKPAAPTPLVRPG